jgi:hypothetical protein
MRLATGLLALLTVVAFAPVGAQQPSAGLQSYDVELIIFRTLTANTSEQLTLEGPGPALALAAEEGESPPIVTESVPLATAVFPSLPPTKFKLTSLEDTLRRTRNYQPIAHIGWTQPGFPRNATQFLPIDAIVDPGSGLKGRIALSRGRYLHLTLDLQYDALGAAGEPAQRVVMRTTRRMRSNERHYIDHPRFGVIAIVTPVTG